MFFGNEEKTTLFLERLIDDADNGLMIYVYKSTTKEPSHEENMTRANGNENLIKLLDSSIEIIPDGNQLYKIHFKRYIIYQTRNESYCSFDPDEIRHGNGLIIFKKSKLLDNIDTFIDVSLVDAWNNAKFQHYGIYTVDAVIDVITQYEPNIEKI